MSRPARTVLFLSLAIGTGVAAVSWPLDELAEVSFAWHMVQHLILLFVVPLFALLSAPFAVIARYAGKAKTAAAVRATRRVHLLLTPPVALAAFVGTLWVTHFSGLYELALQFRGAHVLEHIAYLTAGLLFWLPVVGPPPLRPLPYPARLLYLVVALPQGALVSVALYAARSPLYAHYAHGMPFAAALADQRDAAAVMWILGGAIVLAALLTTLGAWALQEHRVAAQGLGIVALACALSLAVTAAAAWANTGAELYTNDCASCHGANGRGSSVAPPLVGLPATDVHLMLDTGRMPAPARGVNEIHHEQRLTDPQITALVDYIAGFTPGADRSLPRVTAGSVLHGRALFAENCAPCHGASGDGASVGQNNVAPSLRDATTFQVEEAIRAGPGVMPHFGRDVLSDRDVNDIAHYVTAVQTLPRTFGMDAGGITLAHIGPVAEGLIAWLFGLGILILFIRSIGTTPRSP